jgi:hypothetical protein
MNVPIIAMDQAAAKKAYRDYHRLVLEQRTQRRRELREKGRVLGKTIRMLKSERSRLEQEDEELMTAYKALAAGQRVLNLTQVMRAAGVQTGTHLPALAIARATWKDCFFRIENSGTGYFNNDNWLSWRERDRATSLNTVRVSRGVFPAETTDESWRRQHKLIGYPVKAIVPSVPAHLRPANLEKFFILWDAVWEPAPPVDPLLLKRISRDMFVVLATWDLTPLEQSVLEGRLGQ